jgi:protein-S-isoprenylcysteine O-methyltransferase Ste14
MDSEAREADTLHEVANPGIARPPRIYLASIVIGLLLHAVWPLPLIAGTVGTVVGAGLTIVAAALFVGAVRALRAAGTPVPGNEPTLRIVSTGPFRFSRNPIYLAFTVLQLGIAFVTGSLWLVLTLIPAVAVMSLVVIPREERYLVRRFPSEYVPYRAAVRRWL